jgi:hypothetical protein
MRAIVEILVASFLFCLCIAAHAQANTTATSSANASSNSNAASNATAPAMNAPNASLGSSNLTIAGKVDLVEGDVHVYDARNAVRIVHVNDNVFEGDSIVTGSNGEIHLTMADTGFIAVRPNTKMAITQYRANGDNQDKGVIGLLVGSFRSISGWIGKYQPKSYEIRTPTATIGIRGTDHEPKVIPDGSSEGEPGTYDKVNAGGTYINTPQGRVDVSENHAGFAPRGGPGINARPRMLDRVPNFYRPTHNEHLIEGKHAEIQRNLPTRRAERFQQYKNTVRQQRQGAMQDSRMRQRQGNAMQRPNMANRQEGAAANNQRMNFAQRMQAARSAMAERQQHMLNNRTTENQSTNRFGQNQRGNSLQENARANPALKNQRENSPVADQRNSRTLPPNKGNVNGAKKEDEKRKRGQKAE